MRLYTNANFLQATTNPFPYSCHMRFDTNLRHYISPFLFLRFAKLNYAPFMRLYIDKDFLQTSRILALFHCLPSLFLKYQICSYTDCNYTKHSNSLFLCCSCPDRIVILTTSSTYYLRSHNCFNIYVSFLYLG